MTLSLILGCLWVLIAGVAMVLPRRLPGRAAAGLIVTGLPLIGFVFYQNGLWVGLIGLAVALSVLRWPVIRLLQHLGMMRPGGGD